jgi:hypothetical protein
MRSGLLPQSYEVQVNLPKRGVVADACASRAVLSNSPRFVACRSASFLALSCYRLLRGSTGTLLVLRASAFKILAMRPCSFTQMRETRSAGYDF